MKHLWEMLSTEDNLKLNGETMADLIAWIPFIAIILGLYLALATKRRDVGVVVALIGIGLLVFPALGGTLTTGVPTTSPGTTTAPTQPIITTATTVTFNAVDGAQQGTTVGTTNRISVSGQPYQTGLTSFSQGQSLKILFENGTTYHSAFMPNYVVPAATSDVVAGNLNGNSSVTVSVFNTNGVLLTNGGGATNQTVASGGAYTMKVRLDGQDKKSTQDMRCILESTNGTAMNNMVLNGFGAKLVGQSKPAWYTLVNSNSQVWVYDISPVVGSQSVEGSLYVQSNSGKSLTGLGNNGQALIKCVTKENFLDSNTGAVSYNVEDSLGNAKWIAAYTYTIQFT